MKKAGFLFLILLTALSIHAASIRWIERNYDFGLFHEIGGPKTGTSRFVNAGTDTIAIVSVKPSCGCTSADFTRQPLAPGDTAVVSYTYDPNMRPGRFEKSVQVRLSDGSKQDIIITGNVLGTPESLKTLYPLDAGTLKFSDRIITFGKVTKGRAPVRFVNAYVFSSDSVVPVLKSTNKGLSVQPSVKKAGPGDVVTFTLTLNTDKINEYGPVELQAESGDTILTAMAVILPDPVDLQLHQQGKKPQIDLSSDFIDLGKLKKTDFATGSFKIYNSGKAPLELLKIYPNYNVISIKKYPGSIKPGKSADIEFQIDLSSMSPKDWRLPIEIITNDPVRPTQTINVVFNLTQ